MLDSLTFTHKKTKDSLDIWSTLQPTNVIPRDSHVLMTNQNKSVHDSSHNELGGLEIVLGTTQLGERTPSDMNEEYKCSTRDDFSWTRYILSIVKWEENKQQIFVSFKYRYCIKSFWP